MIHQHLQAVSPDPRLAFILPLEAPFEIPGYTPVPYAYLDCYVSLILHVHLVCCAYIAMPT